MHVRINCFKKWILRFVMIATVMVSVSIYATTFPCVVKVIKANHYYYCSFTTLTVSNVYSSFKPQILTQAAPYQACVRPDDESHGNSIGLHMSIYTDNLQHGLHLDDIVGKVFNVTLSQTITKWSEDNGNKTWYVLKAYPVGNDFHSDQAHTLHVSIAKSLQDPKTNTCIIQDGHCHPK
jgi:hypothetical protein